MATKDDAPGDRRFDEKGRVEQFDGERWTVSADFPGDGEGTLVRDD